MYTQAQLNRFVYHKNYATKGTNATRHPRAQLIECLATMGPLLKGKTYIVFRGRTEFDRCECEGLHENTLGYIRESRVRQGIEEKDLRIIKE